MSLSVRRMHPWEVPFIWEFVVDDLQRAIDHNDGEADVEDLWRDLLMGSQSLWIVFDNSVFEITASFTTFIHNYPRKRVLFVALLAGKGMRQFMRLDSELIGYAKEHDCSEINSYVIPEVANLVERLDKNYKSTHRVIVRKI